MIAFHLLQGVTGIIFIEAVGVNNAYAWLRLLRCFWFCLADQKKIAVQNLSQISYYAHLSHILPQKHYSSVSGIQKIPPSL